MSAPLATPSIIVYRLKGEPLETGKRTGKFWSEKPHEVGRHFGPTSAVRHACTFTAMGVPAWIEKVGQPATRLAPSRNPSVSARLRQRRGAG